MKTISAAEARTRFEAVLDESQRAPVVIRDQDCDIAVVLSIADYERLRGRSRTSVSRSSKRSRP